MRLATILATALLSTSSAVEAQTQQFGSWAVRVTEGNETLYAGTVNDSNAVFGQFCYPSEGSCYWLLANNIQCSSGSRYPVLVNADSGASSLEVLCLQIDETSRYAFTNFDAIDAVVKGSQRLGIAFPMANGLFQVNRFSLEGATDAVEFMRAVGDRRQSSSKPRGTKDQTL